MSVDDQTAGTVFVCDQHGTIVQIIRDGLGLGGQVVVGRPLTLVVDRGSLGKALNFMVQLRQDRAAFDWELNVPLDGEVTTLHFVGAALDEQLLILIARNGDEVRQLYDDLMRIGNEQMNALRAATKERSELTRVRAEQGSGFYDELSRLNNDLATLQRELAKKNAELQRLNEQKNRFLGMAAHDLRNPLSIIQWYSEYLLEEATEVLEERHVEFLSVIHSSSEFMLHLVNDFLDVSTIESGQLKLEPWPADLGDLVERNIALNSVLAQKKQIQLSFQQDGALPQVIVDAAKINQVLNNLITNAVKFSYPHSIVEIRLARRGDQAVISVRDEGQGIPADELDRLFTPFERTSVKGTAGEKGSGLGLVISQKIVQGHQGEIWVESEVGKGSTFYVSLPLEGV